MLKSLTYPEKTNIFIVPRKSMIGFDSNSVFWSFRSGLIGPRKFQPIWSYGGSNHEKMVPKKTPRPNFRRAPHHRDYRDLRDYSYRDFGDYKDYAEHKDYKKDQDYKEYLD